MRAAKQVIVLRKDLGMRKGKMIAQGAHASLKVVLDQATINGADLSIALSGPMAAWVGGHFTKVAVSVTSEEELDEVYAAAQQAGLLCAMIVDAGRTEFHGVPTKTCCAIGPGWVDDVDAVTGALSLL